MKINTSVIRIIFLSILLPLITSLSANAFEELKGQSPAVILFDGHNNSNGSDLSKADVSKYNISANVSFNKTSLYYQILDEELQFKFNESSHDIKKRKFLFNENNPSEKEYFSVELLPDLDNTQNKISPADNIDIFIFNELWVDYTDLNPRNPALFTFNLSLESEIKSGSSSKKSYYSIKSSELTEGQTSKRLLSKEITWEEEINISSETWLPKSKSYIFDRTFGLKATPHWYYSQDGEIVLLQRRFDRLISNEIFELVLNNDVNFNHLNLRFNTDQGELIVGLNTLPNIIYKDNYQKIRVRVSLDQLQKNYKYIVLEEMVIGLSGTLDKIVKNKPLNLISWSYIDNIRSSKSLQSNLDSKLKDVDKKNSEVIYANQNTIKTNNINKRIKVDISKAMKELGPNTKISSLRLTMQPTANKIFSGVELSKVRLVSTFNRQVPRVMHLGPDILKNYSILTDPDLKNISSSQHPTYYKYFNSILGLIPTNIDPQGRWIDSTWNVGKDIAKESYLFIGGNKIQSKVLGIHATPYSFLGERLGDYFLNPNEAVPLDKIKGNHVGIDYIKIRVYLAPPYGKTNLTEEDTNTQKVNRSPITELALFKVDTLSFEEIIDSQFPFKHHASLDFEILSNPSNILITSFKDKQYQKIFLTLVPLNNKPFMNDVLFKTFIKNPLKLGNRYLTIKYRVPKSFILVNECFLEMTAIKNEQKIRNKLCIDAPTGTKNIPLPDWVDEIKWKVNLPNLNNIFSNADELSFSIDVLESSTSIRDQIVNAPFLAINGHELTVKKTEFKNFMGTLHMNSSDDKGNFLSDIEYLENHWLTVDELILNKKDAYSSEREQVFNKEELLVSDGGLSWLQLSKYILIFIVAWWLIKTKMYAKLSRILLKSFLRVWNFPVNILNRINIKVGWGTAFLWWLFVAISFYSVGEYGTGKYFFTFGDIATLMSWRALVGYCNPYIMSQWPLPSKIIYSRISAKYFCGFIFILLGMAVMFLLGLDPFAERLAVIGYMMLLVGVVQEIINLRKNKPKVKSKK